MLYRNLNINQKINIRSRFGIGYNKHEQIYIVSGIYEVPKLCFESPCKYWWKKL